MNIKSILTTCFVICAVHVSAQTPLYKQSSAPVESRVKDLLGRMTVDEKIGQLCCPLGWEMYTKTSKGVVPSELYKERMSAAPIGSFWAVLRADPWTQKTLETGLNPQSAAKALNALQKYAIDSTRLGIPILFAEECPHGHMAIGTTVFPTSLAQASTWDKELMYKMGETIALEARLQGANIGYGPVLDIAREPRWSRMEETFGEDPVLTSTLGVAFMKGMQGEVQNDGKHLFSTLKHFAAYGIPESGHNGARANIGMRQLFSDYLHPFKKAVEAGAGTIMTSYNSIDGVPCTANKYLLSDILRKEWGFNGMVMTDWYGGQHATMQMEAGNDLLMPGKLSQREELRKAILNGNLSMEIIDRNIKNILEYIIKTPRFNGYVADNNPDLKAHAQVTRNAAIEGMVLLKNNRNALPFTKNIKKLAAFGFTSYDFIAGGTGSGDVNHAYVVSLIDGLKNGGFSIDESIKKSYEEYIPEAKAKMPKPTGQFAAFLPKKLIPEMELSDVDILNAAKNDDAAVITIGKTSGEFGDRSIKTNFNLTDPEKKMISDVTRIFHKVGKKVVVILNVCGVIETQSWISQPDAVLISWLPGQEGGNSVADIISGKESPSEIGRAHV